MRGTFVEVHGVEQLAPPPDGTLHLAWARFEADDTSPLSAPALIRAVRGLGVDSVALAARLALAGYDPVHTPEYERRRYRLVESRLYRVDEAFPRVVPTSFHAGSVPPGVLRLSLLPCESDCTHASGYFERDAARGAPKHGCHRGRLKTADQAE